MSRVQFQALWESWDAARASGRSPDDVLYDISDDCLIELLAGAGSERAYEKDLIRTELRNRLARRDRNLREAAKHADTMVDRLEDVVEHTRDEAVETEMLARGAAELDTKVEGVAEQAETTAIAAESALLAAQEAERVSGRIAAAANAARPRVRIS